MMTRRPRLTVRRLMIAVALAGLMTGGAVSLQRRAEFAHARAEHHEVELCEMMLSYLAFMNDERFECVAAYHREREARWRKAARWPWLPFEADPPEPE